MDTTDQALIAYLDGELAPDARAKLEAALAVDPALAARLAAHRALADQVRAAFAGMLDEPAPESLTRATKTPALAAVAAAEGSNIVAFRSRSAPAGPPSAAWLWGGGGAIAASLIVGMLVSQAMLFRMNDGMTGAAAIGADMSARGALERALDEQLASSQAGAQVRIGVTFRSTAGQVCRTFQAAGPMGVAQGSAGLACREGRVWRVRMAVPANAPAADGAYATAASGVPAEVMALAGRSIAGDPFDAKAEAQAKANGWK